MNAARWYRERGCVVKGHPLCWHTLTADWLLGMDEDEILEVAERQHTPGRRRFRRRHRYLGRSKRGRHHAGIRQVR